MKIHRLDRAVEVRAQLLQRFPNDPLAPKVLYDNAEAEEAMAEFAKAADLYERYFEENGHRYHHIINPTTGRPTEGILTVTVIGPDGTMTDGLDTAIFVLGVEKGLELIEHYP